MKEQIHRTQRRPLAGWGLFALVGVLLSFGALNIAVRTTSHKLEDGVLWEARPKGSPLPTSQRAAGRWRQASILATCSSLSTVRRLRPSRKSNARSPAPRAPIRCCTRCFASASSGCSTSRSRPYPAVIPRSTSSAPPSASSRCSSAHPSGCGARTIRPRCIFSGSAWRSSAR